MRRRSAPILVASLIIALSSCVESAGVTSTTASTQTSASTRVTQPTSTTSAPTTSTTAPPTTTTTTLAVTTTTFPAADPDVIVIAEDAGEVGVQFSEPETFTFSPFLAAARSWTFSSRLDPAVFSGAWKPGADGLPAPDLVESLPDIEAGTAELVDGSLRLTYRIREGAVWDDGTPVTAADFARTLEILQSSDIDIRDDWRADHAGVTLEGDGAAFTVILPEPDHRYHWLFPVVVPAHAVSVDGFSDEWNEAFWPSAAPFRVVSFERFQAPLAATLTLARVEPPPGHPASVVIDFYQRDDRGESMAIDAFLKRRADVLGPTVTRRHVLETRDLGEATVLTARADIWEALFIQNGPSRLEANPNSVMGDRSGRASLLGSLNRVGLEGFTGPVPSLVELHVPSAPSPSGAWGAVTDCCVAAGTPVTYATTDGELTIEIGRAVEDALRADGWEPTVDFGSDAQAVFERFGTGSFELTAVRLFVGTGPRDLLALFEAFVPTEGFPDLWSEEARSAAFSDLLERARGELSLDEQMAHLMAAEDLLVEELFVIPVALREGQGWAFHPERVTGLRPGDGLEGFLAGLEDWTRP